MMGAAAGMSAAGTVYGQFRQLVFVKQGEIFRYSAFRSLENLDAPGVEAVQGPGPDPANDNGVYVGASNGLHRIARPVDMVHVTVDDPEHCVVVGIDDDKSRS